MQPVLSPRPSVSTLRFRFVLPVIFLLATACGSGRAAPAAGSGADTPTAAVDRFMRLATDHGYLEMGWVFGTERGPVAQRDPAANVERRMAMIASVIANQSYQVGQPRPIPGRVGRAVQVDVHLRTATGGFYLVPFTTVSTRRGRWYIEHVALEAVTAHR